MKKIISFKIPILLALVLVAGNLQSCRQDDENDTSTYEENIFNKNNEIEENNQSTARDSADAPAGGYDDPPVKNGTHWKTQK
ncbi:hypothetical protein SAMN05421664_0742 [Chryseobacterium soldanellicola]|uniref:Secreted protein n=1 Tax=Chryseobacterium soldanellicola TaxID=311333 RepID=A0A1H0YIH9_9FLAO|nr:hypothetical protein [Chryseobacterium soldanellicola]SDQ14863.1 hypothetical protein SAMN05421664_0742 [Chryseobacterium soldanellicola]